MADPEYDLVGFAYGECLEGTPPRSLGFRLLTSASGEAWGAEVETLARLLEAAPYPDHWGEAEAFCSILLSDGRRLVALARYGVTDHTPGQRRGGLELLGMIAPGDLGVAEALAVYRWLQHWRGEEDPRRLGACYVLADVLEAAPPATRNAPIPILPIRHWEEGALLFAARSPSEPDQYVDLLEQVAGSNWQWLPLVGADCPLDRYTERGPLIAWTPHLVGIALQVHSRPPEHLPGNKKMHVPTHLGKSSSWPALLAGSLLFLLLALLGANLWSVLRLHQRLTEAEAHVSEPRPTPSEAKPVPPKDRGALRSESEMASRDRFVRALVDMLSAESGEQEWQADRERLQQRYRALLRTYQGLQVDEEDERAQEAIGALSILAGRSADRVEAVVRKALANKGFSDKVVQVACELVHEEFLADSDKQP
jgi:hypothetical protein